MEMLVVLAILALLILLIGGGVLRARQRGQAVACMSNLRQIGLLVPEYMAENKGYYPWARPSASNETAAGWNWNSYGPSFAGVPEEWRGSLSGGELPYLAGYHEGGLMTREAYDRPGSRNIFDCPVGAKGALPGNKGYSINRNLTRIYSSGAHRYTMGTVRNPAWLILIADNSRGADPDPYEGRRAPPWFMGTNSGYSSWTNTIGFHRHSNKAHLLFADLHVGAKSREEVSLENIKVDTILQ